MRTKFKNTKRIFLYFCNLFMMNINEFDVFHNFIIIQLFLTEFYIRSNGDIIENKMSNVHSIQ